MRGTNEYTIFSSSVIDEEDFSKSNNFLNPLVQTYYDDENPIAITTQMINKL